MRLHPLLFVIAVLCSAPGVDAQEKGTKGAVTLPPVTIVGRIQRPIATVDVNRVQPRFTIEERKPPFFEAITGAVQADPF
jgi:hypothetical protein